ncbi:hypothetical protein ANCCAN_10325 [Ancylostoma caninum]|uniref:ShKT domain-containing protein n=1 Tax=Ancylostoma caninum TaxID=29170 RepID=A0A368GH21_ANCCA|nr:hypothetical protein ANCCAN_10325 [Ancylostoma caninum]
MPQTRSQCFFSFSSKSSSFQIDSTSKDKNIVIAYTPNKPTKQPSVNKNGRGKKKKLLYVVKPKSPSYVKIPLTSPARDAEIPNPDPLAEDVFKTLEKTMASSSFTIEHSNPGKESSQELKGEHNEPEKAASSTHILDSSSSTNHEKHQKPKSGLRKLQKLRKIHSFDVVPKKPKSRLFERLRPHKERSLTEFPSPEPLKNKNPLKKKKKQVKKSFPGDFPIPRNLTDLTSPMDLPRPSTLPSPGDFPRPNKLPAKKRPGDFPRPKKLQRPRNVLLIPKPKPLPVNKTVRTFPRPRILPNKEFPLDFPNPENDTAGHFAGVFPKPTKLSIKKIPKVFPRPETLPTKEFPLDFPEPTTLSSPVEGESIDESPSSITSANLPRPSDLTIMTHMSKFQKPREEDKTLPITSFPRPENFSANPLFLTFVKPGKLITTPRWLGFPRPEGLSTSETLSIALSSDGSTKSESTSKELDPYDGSAPIPKPIFLNFPLPQPLPLNVTITRKTVRRHRKKIHRKRKNSKVNPKKKREELFETEMSLTAKKLPWNIKMIAKPLAKPATPEPLLDASVVEPKQELLITTPLPDEHLVDAVLAESIDEPVSVKSENADEISKPSIETTTVWAYVTAPGERTAAPEVLAAQAAEDSVVTFVDKPVVVNETPEAPVLESVDAQQQQENSVDEPEVLTTTEHYVVAPEPYLPHGSFRPDLSLTTADFYEDNELEPSGYTNIVEPVPEYSPDLPHTKTEEEEQVENSSDSSSKEKGEKRSDLPEAPPQGTPYQMDCAAEVDDKGALCKEWADSGLCTVHRPTMFLFCRKTCLCVGPDARRLL